MIKTPAVTGAGLDQRFLLVVVAVLALTVFIITWVSMRESRQESLSLLVGQGTAFCEALAHASENAFLSESYFDYLIHLRYHEIVTNAVTSGMLPMPSTYLSQLAVDHDLSGVYLFDSAATLLGQAIIRGPSWEPPAFVVDEVRQLCSNPESHYSLLLESDNQPGHHTLYYLEITSALDRVIVLADDAAYYSEALEQTQIGFLAQSMAREPGIEYIVFQDTVGIIFASREVSRLPSIESEPFLLAALDSDSISHRTYDFQGKRVLELVRPFSAADYPLGLLRVALSLDAYYAASRRYDQQIIILSGVLFSLLLVALLYVNSRAKRQKLTRQYRRIKTITDKIFDEMQTGVAAVDSQGRVTLVNRAFEELVGVSDTVGRKWDEVVPQPKLGFRRLRAGSAWTEEIEMAVPGSRESRVLLVAVSAFELERQETGGLVAVASDITQLKRYEKEAARRERLSEMGDLAAGVAHEIRNPLNTISIAVQRLASEFRPDADADQYVAITEQIRSETRRLNEIITRFLALAREERKMRETIRLDKIIAAQIALLRPEAQKLDIEIELLTDSELMVRADPDKIRQVLINLFNNAKEALAGRPGRLTVEARRVNGKAEMVVSDSGPGIDPGLREKVFAPYFTTKEAGTGLGLATVHSIVSDLDGAVEIRDSELGGVAVAVILPAAT